MVFKKLGPATLIAAAFIGPGTITICASAGAAHGLSLLWALLFAIIGTITLQEMSARIGVVTGKGLGEVIRDQTPQPLLRFIGFSLIITAVAVGNGAYEAGNISGAVLGMEHFFPDNWRHIFPIFFGIVAFALLFLGNYKWLERVLVALVLLMSISFITAAIKVNPSLSELTRGMFSPSIDETNILLVVGLIGTTIVPYNLFLHAAIVNEKWDKPSIKEVRIDTVGSIVLGGIVSMCILIAASVSTNPSLENVMDIGMALQPILGDWGSNLIGIGLIAAGLTSAITAPIAAAYALRGLFGWEKNLKSVKFRFTWATILLAGVVFSSLGIKPILVIKLAQIANGLLLPFIAIYLTWLMNKKEILGTETNRWWQNLLALLVVGFTFLITYRTVSSLL